MTDQNKVETKQPIFPLVILIWIMTIIAQLGSLAYSTSNSGQSFQSVVLQSVIVLSLVTLPLSGLGIWLGQKIGLGAPILADLLGRKPGTIKKLLQQLKSTIPMSLLLGAIMVALRIPASSYFPSSMPEFGFRGVLGGLLVSIGAAVGEEVWFRLGLMTIILWGVNKIFGHTNIRPSVAWITIIIAAFVFSLSHLPQLISYGAGSLFMVWGTIIGNTAVGTLYGWCFWRKSLVAAMVSHFSVDLMIHVIPAFFT